MQCKCSFSTLASDEDNDDDDDDDDHKMTIMLVMVMVMVMMMMMMMMMATTKPRSFPKVVALSPMRPTDVQQSLKLLQNEEAKVSCYPSFRNL